MITQYSKSMEKATSVGLSERAQYENVLANVVSGAPKALLSANEWRKYAAIVTTSMVVQGKMEISPKSINYYVGRAEQPALKPQSRSVAGDKKQQVQVGEEYQNPSQIPLQKNKKQKNIEAGLEGGSYPRDPSVEMSVRCSSGMIDEFVGAARKYANVPTDFAYMDQAGTVQRLAAAIAYFANYGELNKDLMLNDMPLLVTSVGSAVASATSNRNGTFISKSADQVCAVNTLAALCFAVCGEGGTVVTDIVGVEAGTNRALVGNPVDSDLAEGCYNALCFLADNYNQVGAGEVFSYALTRGIHAVVTVNSHSDEGAVMRSVLRQSGFAIPFGGISVSKNSYVGLPRPSGTSALAWNSWVDNIALVTAGLVAVCDPCVVRDGELFPTVLTNRRHGESVDFTKSAATSVAEAKFLGAELSNVIPEFAKAYAKELVRVFRCVGGSGEQVIMHMTLCASLLAVHADRHLQFESVAPFYWIEPTGVVSGSSSALPANAGGFGVLCERGEGVVKPTFEKAYHVEDLGMHYASVVKWRTARTSALVMHLNMHREDGLANIVIRQCTDTGFGLTGDLGGAKNVREALEAEVDLGHFLWQRGDCELPHPAECLYTDGALGVGVRLLQPTEGKFGVEMCHSTTAEEWLVGTVKLHCSRPEYIRNCHYANFTRTEKRHRTMAIAALAAARKGAVPTINHNVMPRRLGVVDVSRFKNIANEKPIAEMLKGFEEEQAGDVDLRGAAGKTARADETHVGVAAEELVPAGVLPVRMIAEPIRAPTKAPSTTVGGDGRGGSRDTAGSEPAEAI